MKKSIENIGLDCKKVDSWEHITAEQFKEFIKPLIIIMSREACEQNMCVLQSCKACPLYAYTAEGQYKCSDIEQFMDWIYNEMRLEEWGE